MPPTASVRRAFGEYLLANPNADLRRRLSVLRVTPFPPGSRALHSDGEWHTIAARFPDLQAYVYGTNRDALIYTYDGPSDRLVVELAIVDGRIVPP